MNYIAVRCVEETGQSPTAGAVMGGRERNPNPAFQAFVTGIYAPTAGIYYFHFLKYRKQDHFPKDMLAWYDIFYIHNLVFFLQIGRAHV